MNSPQKACVVGLAAGAYRGPRGDFISDKADLGRWGKSVQWLWHAGGGMARSTVWRWVTALIHLPQGCPLPRIATHTGVLTQAHTHTHTHSHTLSLALSSSLTLSLSLSFSHTHIHTRRRRESFCFNTRTVCAHRKHFLF